MIFRLFEFNATCFFYIWKILFVNLPNAEPWKVVRFRRHQLRNAVIYPHRTPYHCRSFPFVSKSCLANTKIWHHTKCPTLPSQDLLGPNVLGNMKKKKRKRENRGKKSKASGSKVKVNTWKGRDFLKRLGDFSRLPTLSFNSPKKMPVFRLYFVSRRLT